MSQRAFRSRFALRIVIAIVVLLALPSLAVGLFNDDYVQRVLLLGRIPLQPPDPLALYDFAPRDPAMIRRMADIGEMPWWVDPESDSAKARIESRSRCCRVLGRLRR